MQTLVDAVVSQLNRTTMHLNTRVSRITKDADGYQAQVIVPSVKQPSPLHAKAVIVTTPAFVSSQILKELDPTIAETLGTIPYASSALVNLAFDESMLPELDGYGYVIPKVEEREALACTWTSRKWSQRAPKGKLLLRVYIGRYGQEDVTRYSNERLLDIAQREIKETLGINETPTLHRIIRYAKGIPQYNMGHLDRITALETSLSQHPGLHMAGAMFHGVGIPDCIASGESAATEVLRMRNESPSH
jgi:oxygen-dependent protoporphyrinogen oxidase